MNQRNVPRRYSLFSKSNLLRIGIATAFAAVVVLPLFTVSSAPLLRKITPKDLSSAASPSSKPTDGIVRPIASVESVVPFMSFLQEEFIPESVATYASDCTTPKTSFAVGDTACAKAVGTLLSPGKIYWVNSQGDAVQTDTISPTTATATWMVTATGNWKVYLSDSDSLRALSLFTGTDPAAPVVDLSVSNSIESEFLSGGVVNYEVTITNNGPDSASNVVLTETIPNNASRLSSSQDDGPAFACTDNSIGTTCTLSSLGKGASATFTFIYQLSTGIPVGTIISNTATIASNTSELHLPDNSALTEAKIGAGTAPTSCTLDCPNDITVAANTTQNGTQGALVSFANAEGFGDCGTLSSDHGSGSFFPVGSTTVVVTSSAGGGGCSFTVTVLNEGAPTISCPANQTATAPANSSEATVDPGTPTTNPTTGVSVSGLRGDSQALTAPYPVGTTLITWTATAESGLSSTCTQSIIVNSSNCGTDTENPTIEAPADVSITTPQNTVGSCGFVIGESELGTANATDNCSVSFVRTGVPSGNFFPVGTTTITYTATDGAGQTATDTQTVTVIDGSLPSIAAPADANYVCLNAVPAADPSQATRGEVLDENGNPLPPGPPIDNCGAPTVTVAESNNGGAGSASNPLIITRTYTATDAAGNSASDNQTITVADGEAPTITAPPNATYECASAVPAANGSQATASDNCAPPTVTASDTNNGGVGSAASPLIITRTFTATDAAGNSSSATQTITVIDSTAPVITAPAATVASANGSCQSGIPNVVSGTSVTDNCSSDAGLTITQSPAAGTMVTLGTHTITIVATDAVGNSSTASTTFTVNDTTAPTLSCPTNIVVSLPANSSATSMAVNFTAPTATDNCSTPTVTTSLASGSTFPVGTTTVNVTATDQALNSSSCSFTVTVLYNFTGFFAPVDNLPILNVVTAGRAIPVKFSLSGDKGLNIFALNSPYTVAINCDGGDPEAEVEETLNAGGSSLVYQSTSDQYHYIWKTENSWVGTCRQLILKLNDGTEHRANFRFR
jgi:uncharacterized repeat protein (TIGR01451 family)